MASQSSPQSIAGIPRDLYNAAVSCHRCLHECRLIERLIYRRRIARPFVEFDCWAESFGSLASAFMYIALILRLSPLRSTQIDPIRFLTSVTKVLEESKELDFPEPGAGGCLT
jgi:hypothetical protein